MQSPSKKRGKFKDRYEIIEKIGAGRMGVIYKVKRKNDTSGEVFASKHISLTEIDLSIAKKQLRILESLKHMYIIHYYEQFFSENELIIITQFCEGKDLAYHINRMKENKKYFNQNLVSTWIFQLIMAIDYIHSMNIIHRDLKPQNIFVDKDMNLKIGDFGVSKILEGTQHCKTMAGSPLYLSPELIHDENYTKKTDIWSLGCVIFQICVLDVPFKSKKGFYDLCNIIKSSEQKSIPTIYSTDLNKIIKLMLIKDPKKRPSAQQLYQHPILVNLLINYSSNVNLKQQYSSKAIQKPSLTESYVDEQCKAISEKLKKFQEQIKNKMDSFKNKKVHKTQIEKNYDQVQKKMKDLEKVMFAAFQDLKSRGQEGENLSKTIKNTSIENSSKNVSESDITIQSINLGETNKNLSNKLGSSSIASVNSIMLESKNQSTKNKVQQNDFDVTLQSQYTQTIKQSSDAGQVKKITIQRIQDISKQLMNDPSLILDETFLSCTLSLSNNNDPFLFSGKANTLKKKKNTYDITQSQQSLNFDFSKKSYDDGLGKIIGNRIQKQKEKQKQKQKEEQQKNEDDSLEEYEADFQQFEEDKEMDIREQQRQSVKRMFTSTLKNLSLRSEQNQSSYQNPGIKSKYALSLSEIKEISSCAEGSTISRDENQQFF